MSRFDVLLAEDNAMLARLLQAALEGVGARVLVARSVQEASLWLESRRPDLMVLDERLADGDANDIARRAQSLHTAPAPLVADTAIPLLVLVDHASGGAQQPHGDIVGKPIAGAATAARGEARPAHRAELSKPVNIDAFLQQVTRLMGRQHTLRGAMAFDHAPHTGGPT